MTNFIKTILPKEEYEEIKKISDNYIVHLRGTEVDDMIECYECMTSKEPNLEVLNQELELYLQQTIKRTITRAKSAKIAELKEYDASDAVNSFSVNGISMWVPADKRAVLRTSIEAYKALGAESITKVWEGQEYTFSVTEWDTMLNQVEVYASECFNQTQRHIAAINALNTLEEITDYDYTVDYPEKLEF